MTVDRAQVIARAEAALRKSQRMGAAHSLIERELHDALAEVVELVEAEGEARAQPTWPTTFPEMLWRCMTCGFNQMQPQCAAWSACRMCHGNNWTGTVVFSPNAAPADSPQPVTPQQDRSLPIWARGPHDEGCPCRWCTDPGDKCPTCHSHHPVFHPSDGDVVRMCPDSWHTPSESGYLLKRGDLRAWRKASDRTIHIGEYALKAGHARRIAEDILELLEPILRRTGGFDLPHATPGESPSPQLKNWLIYEGRSECWWGPNRGGYWKSLADAGLYTEAEARAQEAASDRTRGDRKDKAVPLSDHREAIERLYYALNGDPSTSSLAIQNRQLFAEIGSLESQLAALTTELEQARREIIELRGPQEYPGGDIVSYGCIEQTREQAVLSKILTLNAEGKYPAALRVLTRHMREQPDDGKVLIQSEADDLRTELEQVKAERDGSGFEVALRKVAADRDWLRAQLDKAQEERCTLLLERDEARDEWGKHQELAMNARAELTALRASSAALPKQILGLPMYPIIVYGGENFNEHKTIETVPLERVLALLPQENGDGC